MLGKKQTILFVTYGGGHVKMVIPIIKELQNKHHEYNIEVLGLPSSLNVLRSSNIKCFGFDKYIDYLKDKDAIEWGNELAANNHSKNLGILLHESVAYLGLCYKDLVVRLGKKNAKKEFQKKGRNAFFPLTVMKRIIDDISPNLVITTNSPRSEAAAIEIANSYSIETLAMTDLFTGLSDYKINSKLR